MDNSANSQQPDGGELETGGGSGSLPDSSARVVSQPLALAGPVTIQVSPDGHVTISVNPAPLAEARGIAGPDAVVERGFGDWLRGGDVEQVEQAERAGPSPVDEALERLRQALKALGDKIAAFAEDVSSLEVRTYVSDRLDQADEDGFFTTAEPRALTHVDLDGDTKVVVPLNAGELDEMLWKVHLETVGQAQAHREAMFRTVMDLVRGIVPTVK